MLLKELDAPELERFAPDVRRIVQALHADGQYTPEALRAILQRFPRAGSGTYAKAELTRTYQYLVKNGELEPDARVLKCLQRKPMRTISGVAPVTVLTKPYPCPGKCIFCPTDARMPKSYLPDEPGAMRAEQHAFDPYAQTASRIAAFAGNGHATDKIELLILGGTWSSYRRDYQAWFVQRCFDAMNGRDSSSLAEAHAWNQTAQHRNVGLVVETRPDHVHAEEIRWMRALGVTKVQMGAQSLDDNILEQNQRGHTVAQTRAAVTMLRAAGFKVVLHWMPNLLGATPQSDLADFKKLWDDPALQPDEIKIYPCSLLANADLYAYWQRGEYHPYSDATLVELVAACKQLVPRYCRINRVYRDIPAPNIVAGSTCSNLREVVQRQMRADGHRCLCLRCREVRGNSCAAGELALDNLVYPAAQSTEHFLSFNTSDDKLAGYLRLSLPAAAAALGLAELEGAAIVREVHVYGAALPLGADGGGNNTAQHSGLGKRLLAAAERIARTHGYERLAVIAAVGTREYYRRAGFELCGSYMLRTLPAAIG